MRPVTAHPNMFGYVAYLCALRALRGTFSPAVFCCILIRLQYGCSNIPRLQQHLILRSMDWCVIFSFSIRKSPSHTVEGV
jgi:hypothetical protein